ncbi:unnamed protein product [Sphenostylis stenocarpa]|uniref:Uncharacterized protein n=1 Tax=Sphenostylis stenocarpa TaxID=92480 RepID=A0AA86T1L1_9FABA|nr:unnamed protein product [Sphenostylis stenocarpa]
MEESKGFVGGEGKKTHPKLPSSSFPIPLPGRNRQASRFTYPWAQRTLKSNTVDKGNGATEKPTLKV